MRNLGRIDRILASSGVQSRYEGEYLAACGQADFYGTRRPRIPRKLKRLFPGDSLRTFLGGIEMSEDYRAEIKRLQDACAVELKQARRMADKLPRMSTNETLILWGNAVGIAVDPAQKTKHLAAKEIGKSINDEWQRRRSIVHTGDYFAWPSTDAPGGDGSLSTRGWLDDGLLSQMGYRVGNTRGEEQPRRRKILAEVFASSLPPVLPPVFLAEWGSAESAARLRKMAESIASFCRNAKRQRICKTTAIDEWERDLEYLYREYYVGKFHFDWPSTQIMG